MIALFTLEVTECVQNLTIGIALMGKGEMAMADMAKVIKALEMCVANERRSAK